MDRLTKLTKLYRYARYRQMIFGSIGVGNRFAGSVIVADRAEIGNYNYFGTRAIIANAVIGNYCSIAPSALIGPAEHSLRFLTTYNPISSELGRHELFGDPAIVGSDVWLGANVVVRQGVRIGNGAVVGANSFVNRHVPAFQIVGGSPARVLGSRFDGPLASMLEESSWWDLDLRAAKEFLRQAITADPWTRVRGNDAGATRRDS